MESQLPTEAPPTVFLLPDDGALSEKSWEFVCRDRSSSLSSTWQLQKLDGESVLVCRGQPYGYLKTMQTFADFRLRLEWRFPVDESGNSGILLYTTGQAKDKVWPTAMQVQLHQPMCGSIFPSGDAKSDNEIRDVRAVPKAVNQWNFCEITSVAGRISVEMNGKNVGEVTGCNPREGGIALQSEGAEVHFRRIVLTDLSGGKNADQKIGQTAANRPPFLWASEANRRGSFYGRWRVDSPECWRFSLWGGTLDHVVHRDTLAVDVAPFLTRHHERLTLAPAPPHLVLDHYLELRSRDRRTLRR